MWYNKNKEWRIAMVEILSQDITPKYIKSQDVKEVIRGIQEVVMECSPSLKNDSVLMYLTVVDTLNILGLINNSSVSKLKDWTRSMMVYEGD